MEGRTFGNILPAASPTQQLKLARLKEFFCVFQSFHFYFSSIKMDPDQPQPSGLCAIVARAGSGDHPQALAMTVAQEQAAWTRLITEYKLGAQ